MGIRGPIGKRSDQRRRRNADNRPEVLTLYPCGCTYSTRGSHFGANDWIYLCAEHVRSPIARTA